MSLELADKQETTKEPLKQKNNLQKEIDKLTFVLNGLDSVCNFHELVRVGNDSVLQYHHLICS